MKHGFFRFPSICVRSLFHPWLLLLAFASLLSVALAADRPPIELPVELRHANYGGGSCTYAAAEDLLSLQGRGDLARYVHRHYAGGVMPSPNHGVRSLVDLAESLGVSYDYSDSHADEHWLQCASDRHLGAVVHWAEFDHRGRLDYGAHAATFLGFDGDGLAWYVNSNDPKTYRHRPRAEFLDIWRRSGGDAFTFVLRPKE